MAKLLETKSIYYKDVNLIAQPSKLRSRRGIPIEGHRIVVSSMSSIIGKDFIRAVAELPKEMQPTLHIPRTTDVLELLQLASDLKLEHVFVGLGINTPHIEGKAVELGFRNVLIDVANGYSPAVIDAVKRLRESGHFDKIVVGSVHTEVGFQALAKAGASVIRSGIAPGSVCITKDATGFTRGTMTEILTLAAEKDRVNTVLGTNYEVLADGGFKTVSDLAKSYMAGADYIMTGRLFVDAKESELRMTTDPEYKDIYYGMASAYGKRKMGIKVEYIEGKIDKLNRDNLRPLEDILREVWQGIQSAVSYSGYETLSEAIGNGVFEVVHDTKNR